MRTATGGWRRPRRLVLAAALVVALTTAACGGGDDGPPAAPGDERQYKIKVGTLRQPHLFAPAFYPRFLPPNISMETIPFANSTEIKNAAVTGSIDFAVTGITAALEGAAQDEPFRVLASA
ncbi:MAG: ABC transporter substrate-binding protein, partial [Acidimicrobiales bacterium]